MEVKQIAGILNTISAESLGEIALVTEDLSNIVDYGTAVFNNGWVEPFSKSLINQIGRMVFVNRKYSGRAPSVLMDSWLYGSILAKVSTDLPEAEISETWEIEPNASYDPNIFYGSKVSERFWNKRVAWDIPKSFTEKQLRQSFTSAEQFNGFIEMLYTSCENALTFQLDKLIMRTINGCMAETINAGKAIDLLKEYNTVKGTSLTPEVAIITEDFLKFASYQIGLYAERMSDMSVNFNVGGQTRFTPDDRRKTVLLADFAKAIGPYTLAGAKQEQYLKLPEADVISFWQSNDQGSYDLDEVSQIKVNLPSNPGTTVTQKYIVGCMFDRDALGVSNLDRRVTTNWNPRAEFTTNWWKVDANYFNDTNENMIVFIIAGV